MGAQGQNGPWLLGLDISWENFGQPRYFLGEFPPGAARDCSHRPKSVGFCSQRGDAPSPASPAPRTRCAGGFLGGKILLETPSSVGSPRARRGRTLWKAGTLWGRSRETSCRQRKEGCGVFCLFLGSFGARCCVPDHPRSLETEPALQNPPKIRTFPYPSGIWFGTRARTPSAGHLLVSHGARRSTLGTIPTAHGTVP